MHPEDSEKELQQLKSFLENFDDNNPVWTGAPDGFPDYNLLFLDELSDKERSKFYSAKTLWDLSRPEKPSAKSRSWGSPEGYRYLAPWSNAVLLRYFVRAYTSRLPKSEYRRKSQTDDAARSVVRNIEEGYKRATTSEYLQFLSYSEGSLEEVKGDIRELSEDGFLKSKAGSSLADLGISLKDLSDALKREHGRYYREVKGEGSIKGDYGELGGIKGENSDTKGEDSEVKGENSETLGEGSGEKAPGAYRPLSEIYLPLKRLNADEVTYEQFMELINKTAFLLRKLAESLEAKLAKEGKAHEVEQLKRKQALRHKRGNY